jgi:c-di-GMP-binding flagellar brake protein YcgR
LNRIKLNKKLNKQTTLAALKAAFLFALPWYNLAIKSRFSSIMIEGVPNLLPKVNDMLYMQFNSIDEDEAKIEYKSRIADVTNELIVMQVPINEKTGKLKRVYEGDEMSAYYVTQGGVKNYFMTSVMGFTKDTIQLILIKKPDPDAITKVQRRSFLRMPAELEVAVCISDKLRFIAVSEDVSGGGISFICPSNAPVSAPLMISCWMLVSFENGGIEHVPFKGELVRLKPIDGGRHLAMVSFTEIHDRDRQKIIRFCFERQLKFRKR